MEIKLQLKQFEGPLDLLLHLIKEAKLDILDLKLEDVINQYLDFINQMETLNLNIAGDYLVMASELIEIKSKKILPRNEEVEEEESVEDLEEKLKQRLIEYKIYKELSTDLKTQEAKRKEIFTKAPERITDLVEENLYDNEEPLDTLLAAFNNFLQRQEQNRPLTTKVTNKELSVNERRLEIKAILKRQKKVHFLELIDEYTKEYVVVTFLTILDMAKEHELVIHQSKRFEEIYCEVVNHE